MTWLEMRNGIYSGAMRDEMKHAEGVDLKIYE